MYVLISVLVIVVCVFLVLIVLVQNSKGGGLAANFSSQNQMMGVRRTADFLEKATWTLAVALLFLCLLASATIHRNKGEEARSVIEDQIENAVNPEEAPVFPTTVPETGE
ncbi:preprotein translocase subunit SecG [Bacteroidota bacterium]